MQQPIELRPVSLTHRMFLFVPFHNLAHVQLRDGLCRSLSEPGVGKPQQPVGERTTTYCTLSLLEIITMNLLISRLIGVSPSSRPEAKDAIRPMRVSSPHKTTRPMAEPAQYCSCTTVPVCLQEMLAPRNSS